MAKYTLDDFSGGLTEFPEDAPPNKLVSSNNVTLTNSKKLRTRPGLGYLAPGNVDYPSVISRATNSLAVYNISVYESSNYGRAVFYSAGNAQMYDQLVLNRSFLHTVPNRGGFVAPDYTQFSTRRTLLGPVHSGGTQLATTGNTSLSGVIRTERGYYWGRQSEGYLLRWVSQFPSSAINAELPKMNGTPAFPANASGFSYIYYFHYYFQYTHEGKTFIDFGPITTVAHQRSTAISGASGVAITNINSMKVYNQAYPSSASGMTCGVAIYRTTNQGTSAYLVGTRSDMGTTFTDFIPDTSLPTATSLLLPAFVYTDGNALDNKSVMTHFSLQSGDYYGPFRMVHANNCLWVVNANNTRQLLQSKPLEYGVFPGSFQSEVSENIQDLSAVDVYPVFFTNNKSFRIEGTVDSRGVGISRVRTISETVGAIRNTAIQVDKLVYFIAREQGIYSTDGFSVNLVEAENPKLYDTIYGSTIVSTAYDNDRKKLYWGYENVSGLNYITDIIELDVYFPNKPILSFYSSSSNVQLRITSLACKDGFLYVGDSNGYLLKFSDAYSDDLNVRTSTSPETSWFKVAIVESFTTVPLSLGERFMTKWFTKLYLFCRQFGSLYPDLTLKVTSIAEVDGASNKELKPIRERGNATKIHALKRWFIRGKIRSRYRQLRIEKPIVILHNSTDYAQATTNVDIPNAVLASGTWPLGIVGDVISFAVDNYTAGYGIVSVSSDTIILGNEVPAFTGHWYIKGYPKNEKIQIEALELEYSVPGETIKPYTPSETGANP